MHSLLNIFLMVNFRLINLGVVILMKGRIQLLELHRKTIISYGFISASLDCEHAKGFISGYDWINNSHHLLLKINYNSVEYTLYYDLNSLNNSKKQILINRNSHKIFNWNK